MGISLAPKETTWDPHTPNLPQVLLCCIECQPALVVPMETEPCDTLPNSRHKALARPFFFFFFFPASLLQLSDGQGRQWPGAAAPLGVRGASREEVAQVSASQTSRTGRVLGRGLGSPSCSCHWRLSGWGAQGPSTWRPVALSKLPLSPHGDPGRKTSYLTQR